MPIPNEKWIDHIATVKVSGLTIAQLQLGLKRLIDDGVPVSANIVVTPYSGTLLTTPYLKLQAGWKTVASDLAIAEDELGEF